jgi:hypothetical protein
MLHPRLVVVGVVIAAVAAAAQDTFPRYTHAQPLETTAETSANISFGDVDRDGHLDIVLAKGRHWPLVDRVLLGDGKRGIRQAYDLGEASDRTYSAALADLDNDGSLDVVISNDMPDPKRVYLNDGKGRFRVASIFGRPEWPTRNILVADVTGDGLPEIIVANRYGPKNPANYICINRGKGQFDAECLAFARYSATTIASGDVDGDGLVDLVVPHRDGGQSYVYLNARPGGFSDTRRIPFGPANAGIRVAAAADFNGDRRLDIVASDERTGVAIYHGQAGGTFAPAHQLAPATPVPYALTTADVDQNGTVDVIVGHVEAPSTIYFNAGANKPFVARRFGDAKGTAYGFAVADLDRDGILDIGVARSDAPNMVFFGSRAGTARRH